MVILNFYYLPKEMFFFTIVINIFAIKIILYTALSNKLQFLEFWLICYYLNT